MRIFATVLLSALTVVLLSSIGVCAEDDLHDDSEKISTSLKIMGDNGRNRTDKVRQAVNSKLMLATLISSTRISNNETNGSQKNSRSLINGGNPGNGTKDPTLPISMDMSDDSNSEEEATEELPEAQELKLIRTGARRRPLYRPPSRRPSSSLNRRNVYAGETSRGPVLRPPRRPTEVKRGPTEKECTFFTQTVCLEAADYPHEAILRSLRTNKEMIAALLTDYKIQDYSISDAHIQLPLVFDNKYGNKYENRYESNEIKRRADLSSSFDNVEEGFTCPSIVKYARPQLARAASGVWKYIINTGEHTQTLRLEKCSNPQSSCSFISENYRSSCVQVYNYHRLLTWDSKLGLHMDIFKVPTCCSCHVHGYSEIFPPHQEDPPPKPKEPFPGVDFATVNDQKDDFQDITRPNYSNKFKTTFDPNLVASIKKPVVEITPSRPTFTLPTRTRQKKPSPMPRPFDKLPQQHAPNTRAPGYTGPLTKGSRPTRPNRPPFRRESTSHEDQSSGTSNSTIGNRYSQPYDQEMDASFRLQSGFDEEYQEPQRRINYNYHPIIDFFKPEASMLQSDSQFPTQSAPDQSNTNSWKPVISS